MGSYVSVTNDTREEWAVKVSMGIGITDGLLSEQQDSSPAPPPLRVAPPPHPLFLYGSLFRQKIEKEGYTLLKPGETLKSDKKTLSLPMQAHCVREKVEERDRVVEEITLRPLFTGATKDTTNEYFLQSGMESHTISEISREIIFDKRDEGEDHLAKTRIFGVTIGEAATKNKYNGLLPLPLFLSFRYLEGTPPPPSPSPAPSFSSPPPPSPDAGLVCRLDEEGLYRVPGSFQKFVRYRYAFDTNQVVDFAEEKTAENIALIVVKFLKELPQSLLYPFEKDFLKIKKQQGDDLTKIAALLTSLPLASKATLCALSQHLQLLEKHHEKNQMTRGNILKTFAICLGPDIGWVLSLILSNPSSLFPPLVCSCPSASSTRCGCKNSCCSCCVCLLAASPLSGRSALAFSPLNSSSSSPTFSPPAPVQPVYPSPSSSPNYCPRRPAPSLPSSTSSPSNFTPSRPCPTPPHTSPSAPSLSFASSPPSSLHTGPFTEIDLK